jgi:hypothetical protein
MLRRAPQVRFESAHHDGFEVSWANLNAAGESLRVEHFEQCGEAVRVAVVRRGGQKQAVLKALGKLAHIPRELARYRVSRSTGGSRMMRLVDDKQRARPKLAKNIPQARDVCLFGQQAMGNDKPRTGAPWVDRKTAKPSQLADALAIDDVERQTKLAFEFVLPLDRHCRRRGDDHEINAPPQQQLTCDKASLDCLAEANVVRDQEIHPGQSQCLAER